MNKMIYYIGILVSAIFYVFGSYYFKLAEQYDIKFTYIFSLSILLGIISYCIKIPLYYYFSKNIHINLSNAIFTALVFLILIFYSKFILNETIPFHSIVISFLIILLILLNYILDLK